MPAELIVCGDPALGVGGEFELECSRTLRDALPEGYVIATNVNIPRPGGEFYECDAVIAAPDICDILEFKCIYPDVSVGEDRISSATGFTIDRVFSKLDHKAKVLASRIMSTPFATSSRKNVRRVQTQVVVPSNTRISFTVPVPAERKPVMSLNDTVKKYRALAANSEEFRKSTARLELRNGWVAYRDASARNQRRTARHLGRFTVRRTIKAELGSFEYFAVDEPPCQMEVRLREFPFDPVQRPADLQQYLRAVARETQVLMKIRHPNIACVIGHFQTGASWVQVSDWFDGDRLEDIWHVLATTSAVEKLGVFTKVIQALGFCHERGVFHRNISADTIRVSHDLNDVRIEGFDCALDLSRTATTTLASLKHRDNRLIAPEDLQGGQGMNSRLSDIFQAGVLLYRLLEGGQWPFSDTLDYVTSSGKIRPFSESADETETEGLRQLALRMMAIDPTHRPDLLRKVEQSIAEAQK